MINLTVVEIFNPLRRPRGFRQCRAPSWLKMEFLKVGMLLQKEFHPIIMEMVMIIDAFFLLTYLVKKIFLVITAYVGIFSFRPRLCTLDSGIDVPPGITIAPHLKIFHITILILFYINLGIALIFYCFFFIFFQKKISVALCLFRSLE